MISNDEDNATGVNSPSPIFKSLDNLSTLYFFVKRHFYLTSTYFLKSSNRNRERNTIYANTFCAVCLLT